MPRLQAMLRHNFGWHGAFISRRALSPVIRMLAAAAMASPVGLLLLGAAFNNTPIELRYLSFGLPFIALLAASAVPHGDGRGSRGSLRRRSWVDWRILVLVIQFSGIIGLLISPRTMQPARVAATEAAGLVGDGVVLLPRGNDGVGIIGAFGIEAPVRLPILLIRPDDAVAERVASYRRVVLALLAQDRDSIVSIARVRAAFALLNWRRVAAGSAVEIYERTGEGEQRAASPDGDVSTNRLIPDYGIQARIGGL